MRTSDWPSDLDVRKNLTLTEERVMCVVKLCT